MLTAESQPMVRAANGIAGPVQGAWTYEDYLAIPDDGRRYEILAGVLNVAPSPNIGHQRAQSRMNRVLSDFVELHGLGEVISAPFDVRLDNRTIVQPDLLFVSSESANKVRNNFFEGAPNLVIEVASPGTATYDRDGKRHAYERAGVPEYWIVDPAAKSVELFVLEGGAYQLIGVYQSEAVIPSTILPEFDAPVVSFFE